MKSRAEKHLSKLRYITNDDDDGRWVRNKFDFYYSDNNGVPLELLHKKLSRISYMDLLSIAFVKAANSFDFNTSYLAKKKTWFYAVIAKILGKKSDYEKRASDYLSHRKISMLTDDELMPLKNRRTLRDETFYDRKRNMFYIIDSKVRYDLDDTRVPEFLGVCVIKPDGKGGWASSGCCETTEHEIAPFSQQQTTEEYRKLLSDFHRPIKSFAEELEFCSKNK
jgi:hypothetical protein